MKIAITGASGLIGSALVVSLKSDGHHVHRLVRTITPAETDAIAWDPNAGTIDRDALEGLDAVVHLAGESIASGRWTHEKKRRILDSRVKGTRLLAEALAGLEAPPRCLISASAIGYYGNRADETLTEDKPPGAGFLPEVCVQWESAAQPAAARGMRVVFPRIGIVLSSSGGALPRMLPPFQMGVGGKIGSGRQYMSWIDLDDLIGVIRHAIQTDPLRGPVNAVAPNPVPNEEFTRILGKVLSRPTLFAMPAFAARIAMGEMADALLLASARVIPAALERSGYEFRYPQLEASLRHVLNR